MFDTFFTSFKLRNTYKANTFIYSLKSMPLIKHLLPNSLYASKGLKIFANVINILKEIFSIFFGKILYLLVMIFSVLHLMKSAEPNTFMHIFFFLTIAGGFFNTHIFEPTEDKYYAMFIMRMDAWEYTVSNYLYYLLRVALGFLPMTLLIGQNLGLQVYTCLIMPFFVCGIKLMITAITLYCSKNGDNVRNENLLPLSVNRIGIPLNLVAAYALPAFGYAIHEPIFNIIGIVVVIVGVFCLLIVIRFREYRIIYRVLLTPNNFAMNTKKATQETRETIQNKIETDLSQTSNQSGYKYFNELFMKRHSKMLTKSSKNITLGLLIVFVVTYIACFMIPEVKEGINELMLTFLPRFLFVMYLINRGRSITQALFMNCDHSMLTYRFYKQPKAILALFSERLKYITAINLLPATIIALGLPLLLYLSGGTAEPINYIVLFVSIIAMSIFFSVHTLVLYYLLQPYNVNMESKSTTYNILNSITYYISWFFATSAEDSTLSFGIGISIFCILYVIVALILAYHLAPKTFKLRN